MAAPYLNAGGTIKYNGLDFLGPLNNVGLRVRPVRDGSDRYITHSIWTFTIDSWIVAGTGANENDGDGTPTTVRMENLRAILQQDGGAFEISGFGYGDVIVNTVRSNYDTDWGPKVRELQMRNIGNSCIVLHWVIDICIKQCSDGDLIGLIGNLKEYDYSVSYSIAPNGCTTRTVQGFLEVWNNQTVAQRLAGPLTETADNYRDVVTVLIPPGFIRTQPQQYRLSEDKLRLSFSVTDTENAGENAYPDGIAHIEFDHTTSLELYGTQRVGIPKTKFGITLPKSNSYLGLIMQPTSMYGYVDVAKNRSNRLAFQKVLQLLNDRLRVMRLNGRFPVVTAFSITDSPFRRRVSFSFSCYLIGSTVNSPINNAVNNAGLFTPLPSTNDANYQQSMEIPWGQRGVAGLKHDAKSDKLVDSCEEQQKYEIRDNTGFL